MKKVLFLSLLFAGNAVLASGWGSYPEYDEPECETLVDDGVHPSDVIDEMKAGEQTCVYADGSDYIEYTYAEYYEEFVAYEVEIKCLSKKNQDVEVIVKTQRPVINEGVTLIDNLSFAVNIFNQVEDKKELVLSLNEDDLTPMARGNYVIDKGLNFELNERREMVLTTVSDRANKVRLEAKKLTYPTTYDAGSLPESFDAEVTVLAYRGTVQIKVESWFKCTMSAATPW